MSGFDYGTASRIADPLPDRLEDITSSDVNTLALEHGDVGAMAILAERAMHSPTCASIDVTFDGVEGARLTSDLDAAPPGPRLDKHGRTLAEVCRAGLNHRPTAEEIFNADQADKESSQ